MSETQQKPTVLLAARSAHTTRLVARHLQEFFDIATASDAEGAWNSLLESQGAALLICEMDLVIDKFGLLERIRGASDTRLAAMPVLLMVGENDAENTREMAFRAGASDFINMPFASTELKARARLHVNLYLQHSSDPVQEVREPVSAVNLLQQLAQEKYFSSRAQQELSFSLRHRSNVSLCKLKLDNVKAIISGFDKATAIGAVKTVAGIIKHTLRREDTMCYLGKAEFYLLYPATNGIGATSAVNRIYDNVACCKMKIAGKKVPVTLSGAVYSCIASESIELCQIYKQLDKGLAKALEQGGNQLVGMSSCSEEWAFSIDRVLKLIESGETDDLGQHAAALILAVMPLVEFGDDTLKLGLESVTRKLRLQLQEKDGDA